MALPPELKPLKRFVREAKRTEKVSKVTAYYCRLYAIQEAMKLDESKKTKNTKQWISDQITLLESCKTDISKDDAKQEILNMANNIFKHADDVDRKGQANKTTAAAFNSSYIFYVILKQFGDRDDEIIERAKYCMFKTTDILKAIKEGRKPKPGPPNQDLDEDMLDDNNEDNTNNDFNTNDESKNNNNFNDNSNNGFNQGFNDDINNSNGFNNNASDNNSFGNNSNNNNFGNNNNFNGNNNNNNNFNNNYGNNGFNNNANNNSFSNNNNYNNNQNNNFNNQQNNSNNFGGNNNSMNMNMNMNNNYNNNNNNNNFNNYNSMKTGGQSKLNLKQLEAKLDACVAAERVVKEAMAAIKFKDVNLAFKNCQRALALLKNHKN